MPQTSVLGWHSNLTWATAPAWTGGTILASSMSLMSEASLETTKPSCPWIGDHSFSRDKVFSRYPDGSVYHGVLAHQYYSLPAEEYADHLEPM